MRNFSKTLISMAAVMAVGSAMAAGAMAGELTIGKDTVKTDGKISISDVTPGKSQYTLLVVQGTKAEGDTEVTYNATEATIKQIDQNDAGVAFTEAVVGTDLADGDYKVMVGNNDGTVDTGYFTLSSAPAVTYKTIYMGDVNNDTFVDTSDASLILSHAAELCNPDWYDEPLNCQDCGKEATLKDGSKIFMGDVNNDTFVDTSDASLILSHAAELCNPDWYDEPLNCQNCGKDVSVIDK